MPHRQITVDALHKKLQASEKGLILDVRTPEEFKQVRIPDSTNVPLPQLTVERVEEALKERGLTPDAAVYVTCATGPRAIAACEKIEAAFPNVYHIVGCVTAWVAGDFPTEQG